MRDKNDNMLSDPADWFMEVVDPDKLLEYLDDAITRWRKERDKFSANDRPIAQGRRMAACYVDAYQSVRMSVFGELLL